MTASVTACQLHPALGAGRCRLWGMTRVVRVGAAMARLAARSAAPVSWSGNRGAGPGSRVPGWRGSGAPLAGLRVRGAKPGRASSWPAAVRGPSRPRLGAQGAAGCCLPPPTAQRWSGGVSRAWARRRCWSRCSATNWRCSARSWANRSYPPLIAGRGRRTTPSAASWSSWVFVTAVSRACSVRAAARSAASPKPSVSPPTVSRPSAWSWACVAGW